MHCTGRVNKTSTMTLQGDVQISAAKFIIKIAIFGSYQMRKMKEETRKETHEEGDVLDGRNTDVIPSAITGCEQVYRAKCTSLCCSQEEK